MVRTGNPADSDTGNSLCIGFGLGTVCQLVATVATVAGAYGFSSNVKILFGDLRLLYCASEGCQGRRNLTLGLPLLLGLLLDSLGTELFLLSMHVGLGTVDRRT